MLSRADAAREIIRRDDARGRLLPFADYTHPRWVTGEHHRLICEHLEAVERGDIKRLLIEAPPRHTKSELASRRFPAWWIGRHPEHQIISASYNDLIGTDIGRDVRNIVRSPDYQNVFPGVELAEDSAAAGRWHTSSGGSYLATGVGGTMTGYGAHLGIIDDAIKNREEADSERVRDTIWHWYTSTFYTRLMPGGAIVMMTTRWHEDDLASRVQQSEKWAVLKLPAIANEGTKDERALWPEWYPLPELHKIRSVLPPRDWQALYQQEPRAEQGAYIKRAWFDERYERMPARESVNVYMASDFGVAVPKEGRDPDYTEHGVFGVDAADNLFVLDWWHGQTSSDVWIEELINLFVKWKPHCWFGEGGVIRHAIEPFLTKRMRERKAYSRIEWLNPVKSKATDGRAFQGRAALGKVRFGRQVWAERVISNVVGFPGATHDDPFDVMAKMCRAIDMAHPAILPPEKKATKRHDYDRKAGDGDEAWKYA